MHHRSNVLDVVRCITQVADDHPEIAVWWYVPRLLENPNIEILVAVEKDRQADFSAIAGKIGAVLQDANVTVARHAGEAETRRLFRVHSRRGTAARPQPA
jgi:hypothetical protein